MSSNVRVVKAVERSAMAVERAAVILERVLKGISSMATTRRCFPRGMSVLEKARALYSISVVVKSGSCRNDPTS